MRNVLRENFPMISTREDVLRKIQEDRHLLSIYTEWNEEQKQAFLDMLTGIRGVKILYDSFFKTVMDPELTPERPEEFLSLILGQKVKILKVLPLESPRLGDESSLVVMDMVVELEDHSIVNLEVQKLGYRFPGERSACYSADLLLRQYKRVRGERQKKFSYKDIKDVYTIVLYEKSTLEFSKFPDLYIHNAEQKTDTGLQLNLLQKYTFIPLDIFRSILHNKGIRNKLEAWLTFLSVDEPAVIVQLIQHYPQFKIYYEEIYELCRNIGKVMEMFSKELRELDKNTVQYMIDEMQEMIDAQTGTIDEQKGIIDGQKVLLEQKEKEISELKKQLEQLQK